MESFDTYVDDVSYGDEGFYVSVAESSNVFEGAASTETRQRCVVALSLQRVLDAVSALFIALTAPVTLSNLSQNSL